MNLSQLRWVGLAGAVMVIIALISIGWGWWPESPPPPPKSEARAVPRLTVVTPASAPAARPVIERRVTAYPDRWSEPVVFPPNAWFRLDPQGKVKVRDLRGKEWDDEPGAANWAGEENVANFAFRFRSRVSEPVEVVVYHHSK